MKAIHAIMPVESMATIQRPREIDALGVFTVAKLLPAAAISLFEFDKMGSLQLASRESKIGGKKAAMVTGRSNPVCRLSGTNAAPV